MRPFRLWPAAKAAATANPESVRSQIRLGIAADLAGQAGPALRGSGPDGAQNRAFRVPHPGNSYQAIGIHTRRYAWFESFSTGLFVTVRYSQHGTGSGWTAGGLMGSRGSSPAAPGQAHPGRRRVPTRWLSGPAWEQHKSNTSPAIYEDQHAGNTDKTAFHGTRRHDR